jgi:hypothetical protein
MTVVEFLNKNGINTLEDVRHGEFANDEMVFEEDRKGGQRVKIYRLSNHPGHFAQVWKVHTEHGLVPAFGIYER